LPGIDIGREYLGSSTIRIAITSKVTLWRETRAKSIIVMPKLIPIIPAEHYPDNWVGCEVRVQVREDKYRVPDVTFVRGGKRSTDYQIFVFLTSRDFDTYPIVRVVVRRIIGMSFGHHYDRLRRVSLHKVTFDVMQSGW